MSIVRVSRKSGVNHKARDHWVLALPLKPVSRRAHLSFAELDLEGPALAEDDPFAVLFMTLLHLDELPSSKRCGPSHCIPYFTKDLP
jgi:hypothetical protein